MEQHLVKLNGDSGALFALSSFLDSKIELSILHEQNAYSCELKYDELKTQGEELNVNNLIEWAKVAFGSSMNNSFRVAIEGKLLKWSKFESENSTLKIGLGSYALCKADFQATMNKILEASINQNRLMCLKNEELSAKQSKLMDEVKEDKKLMKVLAQEKNQLEESLYSKFLPILHAKQDKIRELTLALESGSGSKSGANNVETMEEDSYGSGTDVDEVKSPAPVPGPSKVLDDSQNFLNI